MRRTTSCMVRHGLAVTLLACIASACSLFAPLEGPAPGGAVAPAERPAGGSAAGGRAAQRAALAEHRAVLAAEAAQIAGRHPAGLEAFASFVQRAADGAVAHVEAEAAPRAAVRLLLDDLVDLSLGAERPFLQRLLMASPPMWTGPPVHEAAFGMEGFAPLYHPGEGRLRHFALAAAAGRAFPDAWVEAAARWIGGDFRPRPDTDGWADVATNAAGRDFARWLAAVDAATLADGESVAAWVRERFGPAVP